MKVGIEGEVRIKFKHFEIVDDEEEILNNDEIKNNLVEMVERKLGNSLKEIEVNLINCNIVRQ